ERRHGQNDHIASPCSRNPTSSRAGRVDICRDSQVRPPSLPSLPSSVARRAHGRSLLDSTREPSTHVWPESCQGEPYWERLRNGQTHPSGPSTEPQLPGRSARRIPLEATHHREEGLPDLLR